MSPDAVIEKLYEILGGEPVLIPHHRKSKKPVHTGWTKTTYAATREPDYQMVLQGGNIGVLLGPENLACIDIDDDEQIAPFFSLNPGLAQTVMNRGKRGLKIFIRFLPDEDLQARKLPSFPHGQKNYPIKCQGAEGLSAWGELRMSGVGAMLWGSHPDAPVDYTFVTVEPATGELREVGLDVPHPVKEVYFRDIEWPRGVSGGWRAEHWGDLTLRYGLPWSVTSAGDDKAALICALSAHFWAGWFSCQHHILWEPVETRFYQYNPCSGGWETRESDEIRALLSDELLRLSRDAELRELCYTPGKQPPGWSLLEEGALAALERARTVEITNSILRFLTGIVTKRDVFKTGTGVIHLRNGMLDLREAATVNRLTLKRFSPKFYSRNPIPVDFDKNASAPRFRKELVNRALENKDADIDFFYRWGGQVLLGKNDAQKLMIFSGTASGGKSTMLKVVQRLLGRKNVCELRTEQLAERFELYAYVGKTLLVGNDVAGNFLQQKGAHVIKKLTGGDWMSAEVKGGKDYLEVEGNYNIGIVCNSRLKVRLWGDEEAWRRRLAILVCNAPPVPEEKRIKDFDELLVSTEGPGIINLFIRGAMKVMRGQGLKLTEEQKQRVDNLLDESDSVRVFLSTCVTAEKGQCLTKDALRHAYAEFCDENGWDAESERTFEQQCKQLMLEKYRAKSSNSIDNGEGRSVSGYRGVTFIDSETETNQEEPQL